jgi:NAD+ kinase
MIRSSSSILPELPYKISSVGAESFLSWGSAPKRVLVSKKYNDTRSRDAMSSVCQFLREQGAEVVIDSNDPDVPLYKDYEAVSCSTVSSSVDFVVCLGGDGTVLRTIGWIGECSESGAWRIPPVLAFGVGSLGFLAPFAISDYKHVLMKILAAESVYPITLRTRLKCEVFGPDDSPDPIVTRRVLNECLVARGSHSAFQHLDCEIDGMKVAQFQADGLIIATPSGSSAYSMAAGGSLVAPSVPCTLLTPVAPHGLSARPLILPDSSVIEVKVPSHARARPIISFDGHHELVLDRLSRVRITRSRSFVPFFRLTQDGQTGVSSDWFVSLRSKLHWAREVRNPSSSSL